MIFPDYIERRYMRGHCLAFAIALKRETGWPLYAAVDKVKDREDWHHAFVVDELMQRAYDVRGSMDCSVSVVAKGMASRGEVYLKKCTIREAVDRMKSNPTLVQINEARSLIRPFLDRIYLRAHTL